jgi:hypothetical protein
VTTSVADACATRPAAVGAAVVLELDSGAGFVEVLELADRFEVLALEEGPTGHATGVADWYFVVELLGIDDPTAFVGRAVVGETTVPAPEWYDITDRVRGMTWAAGCEELGGRPATGVAELTLDNRDGRLSGWNTSRDALYDMGPLFRPGTVIRWGVISATEELAPGDDGWCPLYTGVVEAWGTASSQRLADGYVSVTVVQTSARAARIDLTALSSNRAAEVAGDRIEYLLERAGWPYGFANLIQIDNGVDPVLDGLTVQETSAAGNLLGLCYLTADSTGAELVPGRTGRLELVPRIAEGALLWETAAGAIIAGGSFVLDTGWPDVALPTYAPMPADTAGYVNDDVPLVTRATIALVGDVDEAVTVTDAGAELRHGGAYTYERTDLITDGDAAGLASYFGESNPRTILAGARIYTQHRRCDGAALDIGLGDLEAFAMWSAWYGTAVSVIDYGADGTQVTTSGYVAGVSHELVATGELGLEWRASLLILTTALELAA